MTTHDERCCMNGPFNTPHSDCPGVEALLGHNCRYCRAPLKDNQEIAWRMCSACYSEGVAG